MHSSSNKTSDVASRGILVLAGGSGSLGQRLVPHLARAGWDVRIVSRAAGVDVRDRAAVQRALDGAGVVVSAMSGFGGRGVDPRSVDLEGNRNLIDAAVERRVDHFVLVSCQGAAADHPIELFRCKHAAEEHLAKSGLASTVVRPTASLELWIRITCGPLAEKKKALVLGRGENPVNFVSVHDVAHFVERAVEDPALRGAAFDVGGPENLTMTGLVETFSSLTGMTGPIGHVPRAALRAMSILARPFASTFARMAQAAVVMDTTDMTFDATALQQRFSSSSLIRAADAIRRDWCPAAERT
jgi:NADH dehydrogenase